MKLLPNFSCHHLITLILIILLSSSVIINGFFLTGFVIRHIG